MISIILISAIIYLSVGVVAAIILYVRCDGYKDADEVVADCFLWPLVVLGAGFILTGQFVKWVGDWILARRAKAE